MHNIYNKYKVFIWLVGIDLLMVLLSYYFFQGYSFFDLNEESNLPTAYQSLKLLTFGYIFLHIYWFLKQKGSDFQEKLFWIFPAILLIYVGIDDMGHIHEEIPGHVAQLAPNFHNAFISFFSDTFNYNSAEWLIYFSIPIVLFIIPLSIFQSIKTYEKSGAKELSLFSLAICLFIVAFALEYYVTNSTQSFSGRVWGITSGIEEASEMIGVSIFGFIFYSVAKKDKLLSEYPLFKK